MNIFYQHLKILKYDNFTLILVDLFTHLAADLVIAHSKMFDIGNCLVVEKDKIFDKTLIKLHKLQRSRYFALFLTP